MTEIEQPHATLSISSSILLKKQDCQVLNKEIWQKYLVLPVYCVRVSTTKCSQETLKNKTN